MDPMYEAALQIIREAKTELKLAGDGRQIFNELKKTLIQFRRRLIRSSTATHSLQNLLQNQPQLLQSFKPFFPAKFTAERSSAVTDSVDFMNRISTQFGDGEVRQVFTECMIAYSNDKISDEELRDAVVGIFVGNDELIAEFMRFFAGSDGGERSRKRSLVNDLVELPPQKRSRSNSGNPSDNRNFSAAVPPPWSVRISGKGENKEAAKRNVDRDRIEDLLYDIDVQIRHLELARRSVEDLAECLRDGLIFPAIVRLGVWFTQIEMGFMKRMDRKTASLIVEDHHMCEGLEKMMKILNKKKIVFDKERSKILRSFFGNRPGVSTVDRSD